MDIVRTRRQPARARSPLPGDPSGKSEQSAKSTILMTSDGSNKHETESLGLQSPKTSNLIYTDNGSLARHDSVAKSATNGTSNGKNSNCNYIAPAQCKEHNTRSKNGIRKEVLSVSIKSLSKLLSTL